MPRLYPIRLEAQLHRRLWGGRRLPTYLGRTTAKGTDVGDPREPVGEAWLAGGGSRVANGALRGRRLDEVAAEAGPEFVGTRVAARYGARMPLLAKLIDSADRLSIQVHPDDAYARAHPAPTGGANDTDPQAPPDLGKAEAWLVLATDPSAEVLWGWQHDVSSEDVRKSIDATTLETALNHVDVRPGDVIYNPPGTVHAIGAGVFLFEIQQASDLTYRLYDYGRRGADGAPRDLHVDAALDVADLRGGERAKATPTPGADGWTRLLSCEHFVLERHELADAARATTDPGSLEVLVLIEGRADLHADPRGIYDMRAGDAYVLPASLGSYRVEGEGVLVRSYVPGGTRG